MDESQAAHLARMDTCANRSQRPMSGWCRGFARQAMKRPSVTAGGVVSGANRLACCRRSRPGSPAMIAGDMPGPQPLARIFQRAALDGCRGVDSRPASGADAPCARRLACSAATRCRRSRRRRAKMAHAFDALTPSAATGWGSPTRRRHHQRLPAWRVGDRARHPPQPAGEADARRRADAAQWCCRLRPQRRRFRNSPFLEIPSIRAASSTRPCVLSSALLTIVCSSSSTAAGSG